VVVPAVAQTVLQEQMERLVKVLRVAMLLILVGPAVAVRVRLVKTLPATSAAMVVLGFHQI
jgi:hypothetical protein